MSWCLTRLLRHLSIPALHAPGPHMLQVQSRRTPETRTQHLPPPYTHTHTHTPPPSVNHTQLHVWLQSDSDYTQGSDLGIVPPAAQLLVRLAPLCVLTLSPPRVCVCLFVWLSDRIHAFLDAHLRHPAPGRALSRPKGKPLGNVGSGRLPGMCAQSCQMDLCPSRLRLAPGR